MLLFPLLYPSPITGSGNPNSLKLLISVEQPTITAPFPARVTLNLHNGGQEALWLYRRARGPRPPATRVIEENRAPETSGGSMLVVKLEPAATANSPTLAAPAQATVMESVGFPRPKLVRLTPGDDYEEKTILHLEPARVEANGQEKPLWGRYRLSIVYQARFSNAAKINRNLQLTVWQGEVASNTVEIELLPPSAAAQGTIAGPVITADSQPVEGVRVSLSDQQERVVNQVITNSEGRFSFSHLPWGLYWVTARRENASEDTAAFRHAEITSAEPAAAVQLVFLQEEIYEARKILHQPVLFVVTDSAGRPLSKVGLEATWSSGTVLDNVKGETGEDGAVALELIPGRNFLTLKRRGCPKQDERADVAAGEGIDGFKFVSDCAPR